MKALIPLFLLLHAVPALACLHFDQDYKPEIKEGEKLVFAFHDGKNAHLILKTDLEAKEGMLPKTLAWVMPFPALPSQYSEVSPELFLELKRLFPPKYKGMILRTTKDSDLSVQHGIEVHELKTVGNYRIQPIELLSDTAGNELNLWLKEHHFNPMPDELQKPYLKKGAVFLAIQVQLNGSRAHLKPLHIVYPAQDLSFPLRFTHDTRTFDMTFFVFTEKELRSDSLASWYFDPSAARTVAITSKALEPNLARLIGARRGYISRFKTYGVNTGDHILRKLKSDPMVRP